MRLNLIYSSQMQGNRAPKQNGAEFAGYFLDVGVFYSNEVIELCCGSSFITLVPLAEHKAANPECKHMSIVKVAVVPTVFLLPDLVVLTSTHELIRCSYEMNLDAAIHSYSYHSIDSVHKFFNIWHAEEQIDPLEENEQFGDSLPRVVPPMFYAMHKDERNNPRLSYFVLDRKFIKVNNFECESTYVEREIEEEYDQMIDFAASSSCTIMLVQSQKYAAIDDDVMMEVPVQASEQEYSVVVSFFQDAVPFITTSIPKSVLDVVDFKKTVFCSEKFLIFYSFNEIFVWSCDSPRKFFRISTEFDISSVRPLKTFNSDANLVFYVSTENTLLRFSMPLQPESFPEKFIYSNTVLSTTGFEVQSINVSSDIRWINSFDVIEIENFCFLLLNSMMIADNGESVVGTALEYGKLGGGIQTVPTSVLLKIPAAFLDCMMSQTTMMGLIDYGSLKQNLIDSNNNQYTIQRLIRLISIYLKHCKSFEFYYTRACKRYDDGKKKLPAYIAGITLPYDQELINMIDEDSDHHILRDLVPAYWECIQMYEDSIKCYMSGCDECNLTRKTFVPVYSCEIHGLQPIDFDTGHIEHDLFAIWISCPICGCQRTLKYPFDMETFEICQICRSFMVIRSYLHEVDL
ncbi:hypothetical protein PCE1_000014 [Barthelona sp. PCE]